jgi:F420-dependent oxidoreductase-like protein
MQPFDGQLRFGIHAGQQNTDYASYAELWRQAEAMGLDWASVFDHFLPIYSDPQGPCFEGFTLLAAMAAQTSRLRCGIVVSGITYRHPALLANIAVTLDHISGGRFELGLGAAWYELEHEQYGIDFPRFRDRADRLREASMIVKQMWTQERTTFDGDHFHLTDALCEPKPVQTPSIPLWIGGAGERVTLRVVAEVADGWNTFLIPPEEYRHKVDVLAEHCASFGRDPRDIRRSLVAAPLLAETESELQDRVDALASRLGIAADEVGERFTVATAERFTEMLLPYLDMGVGDVLVRMRAPADGRTMELFATSVAPALRDA